MLCVQKAQCKLKPPSFAPPCVDKTEDVQQRNGMRIPPPLTRTWYVSERTEKRRAGQTEGLHLLLTVTVTSSPLKTMLHISLSSQPDLRRGHWPGIMMWSEVNICHGDKADSSKTTFWMMNKWEKCQFTITHSANGVLRHLWSPPFISLSHAMKTQGDLQSFSVFFPLRWISLVYWLWSHPPPHCPLGVPCQKLCSLSKEAGSTQMSRKWCFVRQAFLSLRLTHKHSQFQFKPRPVWRDAEPELG